MRLFAGSLLGKCLGIVRELALAANFGTGVAAGCLRASRVATVLPTSGFGVSVVEPGFVPLYTRCLKDEPGRAGSVFWTTFSLTTLFSVLVGAALWIGAPLWASMVAPGFDGEAGALTARMIRAMAFAVPMLAQARVLSGLEMAHGRYVIQSLRSTAENTGVVAAILAAAFWKSPWMLGWGLVAYAVVYQFIAWSVILQGSLLPHLRSVCWESVRSVAGELAKLLRLLWILPLAGQGILVVERILASLVSVDAVAALGYARAVSETGTALVAIPLGLVGLSELSRVDVEEARERLRRLVPLLLVGLLPCSLFLALNATTVVDVLFARGQFGAQSTAVTAMILTGLGVGLWAQVSAHVLLKGLNASGRNREAVRATLLAAAAQLLVTALLFRHYGALALGLGASAFEVCLLACGLYYFRLFSVARDFLAPLLGGASLYWLVSSIPTGGGLAGLLRSGGLFLLFWTLFVLIVPRLREVAVPFVQKPFLTQRTA